MFRVQIYIYNYMFRRFISMQQSVRRNTVLKSGSFEANEKRIKCGDVLARKDNYNKKTSVKRQTFQRIKIYLGLLSREKSKTPAAISLCNRDSYMIM